MLNVMKNTANLDFRGYPRIKVLFHKETKKGLAYIKRKETKNALVHILDV